MYIKVNVPQHFQFKMIPSFMELLFPYRKEVHYIGGADVLPPPLSVEEEAECIRELLGEIRRKGKNG